MPPLPREQPEPRAPAAHPPPLGFPGERSTPAPLPVVGHFQPFVPRRLFILRPDHLGDLVLFSGAIRHIRRHWPETHITLCVRSYGRQLYGACPLIDRLFPYEDLRRASPINWIPWFPGSRRFRQFLRDLIGEPLRHLYKSPRLKGLEFDLAVMPLRSPEEEYHPLMRMVAATQRLSFCGSTSNHSRAVDLKTRPYYTAQLDGTHLPWDYPELEMTRTFLEFMGIPTTPADLWPEFWTKPEDQSFAESAIEKRAGQRILGLAPGVTVTGKALPPAWYAAALAQISGPPLHVVLLGAPGDIEICQAVEQAIRGSANVAAITNLTGKTSIRQMIECVRRCDLMLAQETAALHIATGLRAPVVGIVGGGHFGRFFPWGDPERARWVNHPMECYGCNWICKYDKMHCIQDIDPAAAARGLNALPLSSGS